MAELAKKAKLLSVHSETFPCSLQERIEPLKSTSYQKREKLMFSGIARPSKVKHQITNFKSNNVLVVKYDIHLQGTNYLTPNAYEQ